MLILPKSCFLHIPKTGGTWVTGAIKASGLQWTEFRPDGDAHASLEQCPCPEKYKIAFVRHPVQVYRSYWQYKMGTGWEPKNYVDQTCAADDFQTFVRNVIERYPGILGPHFERFVGPPENEIEFIGKYENLVEDLVLALHQAGEAFDEDIIRNFPQQNVSDKILFPAEYTPDLERAVRKSEYDTIKRFEYE
jgi:hypothetical protein